MLLRAKELQITRTVRCRSRTATLGFGRQHQSEPNLEEPAQHTACFGPSTRPLLRRPALGRPCRHARAAGHPIQTPPGTAIHPQQRRRTPDGRAPLPTSSRGLPRAALQAQPRSRGNPVKAAAGNGYSILRRPPESPLPTPTESPRRAAPCLLCKTAQERVQKHTKSAAILLINTSHGCESYLGSSSPPLTSVTCGEQSSQKQAVTTVICWMS